MELGQLLIDVGISESSLSNIENKLKERAAKISTFNLRPVVDHTELTKLNKHLDKKISHLKEVNSFYSSNAIKPTVDFTQTERLKSDLQQVLNLQKQVSVGAKNNTTQSSNFQTNQTNQPNQSQSNNSVKPPTPQSTTVPNTNISVEELRRAAELSTNQLLIILNKNIAQGFKKQTTVDPIGSFATGIFEGFGKNLSDDLTKGAKKAIKNLFNIDLGKFVEEEITKVAEPIRTRPKSVKREKPSKSKKSSQPAPEESTTPDNFYTPVNIPEPTEKEKVVEIIQNVKSANTIIKAVTTKNFSKVIDESLKVITRELGKERPDISTASAAFTQIRESFKNAYGQMNKAMSAGNTNLAEAYAKTIVKTSDQAFKDIDQIVKQVSRAGFPDNFGSPIKTLAGSTKGVLTSRYVNPSKRTLTNIGNKAQRDEFVTTGKQVISGLAQGLGDPSPATREASNVSFTILNAFRKTLGIQSPSRRAWEIGKLIIEGLKLGLTGDVDGLKSVAGQIAGLAIPSKESVRKTIATIAPNLLPQTFSERRQRLGQYEASYPDSLKTRRTNFLGFKDGKYVGITGEDNFSFNYLKPKEGIGSKQFFEGIFSKGARVGTKAMAKGFPTDDAPETVARQAAVMALTSKPEWIAGALASPLAIPLLPSFMAIKVARNILTPVVNQVYAALQDTSTTMLKLSNLAGSEKGGKEELGFVKDVSNKYSSELRGGASAYSDISFATKGTKLQGEDTRKLYEGIAAATKFVGADASKASLIFQAFTQMISKGKVSMEELRLQLSESFPPAMQVFAKAIGKSVPELTELISKGAILSEDILPKVADVLLNDFSKGASSAAASFVQASNRIQNAFFDFQLKITESFGGMVTGVINLGAGIFEGINSKIHGLSKAFNLLAVSIVASTAAGFSVILGHEQIAGKLKIIQNLFAVSFRRTASLFTPFIAGTFIDLIDDFFGVKNSTNDNVAKGVTNFITGIFTGIDVIARGVNKKGLFSVGLTDKDTNMIDSFKNSIQSLFSVVPKGVIEMVALILMFQQCALLAHTYVMPSLIGVASSLKTMGAGIANAVLNFGNMRDSMKDFFPLIAAQAKNVAGALIGFGLNAAAALAVMSLAQSDFSNPLQKSFDLARTSIKGSLDAIGSDLNKLKLDAEGVGKAITGAIKLPSKGLELNLFKVLGLSGDSFKTDDLISKFNKTGFVKGANRIEDYLEERTKPVEKRQKTLREQQAKKVQGLGLEGYVNKDDQYLTLSQIQLLNNAKELSSQRKDLNTRLGSLNLSPETIGNFQTGGTKKAIEDLRAMDKEIYSLSQRRSQISLGTADQGFDDPKTKKDLSAIDSQINALVEKRKVQGKGLGNIFGSVGDIKTQLAGQLKAIDDADIPASAKTALKDFVQPQIDEIDKVVKYLKDQKLYDLVTPLASIWQEVTDKLTTAENAFTRVQKVAKLTNLQTQTRITSGANSEGSRQSLLDTENLNSLNTQENQIAGLLKTRTESLEKLLTVSNVETAPNSKDDIKALRENIDKDKESLAETRLQIAQSRLALVTKLRDQVKQVNDFYSNLNRQVEQNKFESQKIAISVNASNQQAKLRSALTGGFDTIVSQFIESILSVIETSTSSSQAAIDAQSQLLQNRYQLQDNLKAGNELAKQLPGYNAQKPTGIAKGLLDADKITAPLKNSFGAYTNEQPDKVLIKPVETFSASATNEAKTILTQTSNQTADIKQQIADTKKDLNEINQTSNIVATVFDSWVKDLQTVPGILKSAFDVAVQSVASQVTSLSGSVQNIYSRTIPDIASQIGLSVTNGINQGILDLQNAASVVANAFLNINSESISSLINDIQASIGSNLNNVLGILNEGVQATLSFFTGGFDNAITTVNASLNGLTSDLNKNIGDIVNNFGTGINKGINDFVNGMSTAVNNILEGIKNFKDAITSFNPQTLGQKAGDTAINVGDTIFKGVGNLIQGVKQTVFGADKEHHGGKAYNERKIDGKSEMTRSDGGVLRLVKDIILQNPNGSQNAPVQNALAGTARLRVDPEGYGNYVEVLNKQGEVLTRMAHLASFAPGLQSGQQVIPGQIVGTQGSTGHSTGTHLHLEIPPDKYAEYIQSVRRGSFTGGSKDPYRAAQDLAQTSGRGVGNQNMVDPRQTVLDTRQDTTGLTALGKKYLAASQTKQFQAMAYAIGIAETGDILGNNGMSYGAGENDYKTARFKNFASLTAVPPSAGNAFGNYQINQQDNLEAQRLLGTRNLSKRDQDIIGAWRLDRQKALDPLLKGDLQTAVQRGGGEFGSFEGAPKGGHSAGGKFATIQANVNKYLSASGSIKTSTGSQLQQGIAAGNNQAIQLSAQREAQINANLAAQQAKDKENQRIQTEKAIRTLKDQSRNLQIESRNEKKQASDSAFATIFNPTIAQKNKKAEDDIKYEVADLRESAEYKLQSVKANREHAENALKINDTLAPDKKLPTEALKALQEQLPVYRQREKDLTDHIKKIKELENQRLNFQKQTADREETLRTRNQTFAERQRDLDVLQEQINKLTTLKSSSPNDKDVQNLPNLQRVLDLKKEELSTDQERSKLSDDLFNHTITQQSYDKQLAGLNQRSKNAKDSIQIRSNQALTQQDIDRLKRDLDGRKSEQENTSATANLNVQKLLDSPSLTKSSELLSARKQVFESDSNAENLSYESKRLEYEQLKASDNSQPERIKKLYSDLDKLHLANLESIKLKHERLLLSDKSDASKRQIEVQTQINEQLEKINSSRLTGLQRIIGKTQSDNPLQNISQSNLRQKAYDVSVASQQQSYLKDSNEIDDLEIANKRTPSEIKELRQNLEALNKVTLQGLKDSLEDALNTDVVNRFQHKIDILTNSQYLESSGLDARKAQIAQNVSRGGNPFVNNRSQRETGKIDENNRYLLENLELDKKVAELRTSGLDVPDEKVSSIKENLLLIHNINLDNLNDQFKTFGGTIDDIAKTGLQGLSQSIADVITEGGDLGSVFQNLFKTIANGFIKNGLDSLIGGLTGNLFGGGRQKSGGLLGDGLLGSIGDIFGGGGGGILSILGFSEGGNVPAVSGGSLRNTTTQIGNALKKEGSNAVLAALTPGERVLNTEEASIYNLVYPKGIKANYRALNFNEGGSVGKFSQNVTNKFNNIGSTSNSPTINIQQQPKEDLTGKERESVKLIRAVVVAELNRQNAPGGINRK